MPSADELLRQGDLDGARAALVEVVRARPGDPEARIFLFQLMAVAGEWTKARTHLDLLAKLSAEAQMLAVAYNQALEAEIFRSAVFDGTATAPILTREADWAKDIAEAIKLAACGEANAADDARGRAFDAAPDTPGTLDGIAFDWIADADARFGPTFEAIIAGQYGLVPFSAVEKITSEGPKDLRDIVWYPVQIGWKNGQSVAGMLPARYPGTEHSTDGAERLARATSWRETPVGEAGSGQHLLALSGGEERGLLELRALSFA
ncbi:type VI secretion system accessory protein TagJ [Sphingomonas jatrophae]|uniref:Type VI secretion system protein ImpE n=1 Tax=Sphingomonas jatrophae TaxID=1166337 RepID=A0A1I6LJR3_9SPHN|nr:type VI secretion system accessory protein TagJ [Sphingomonas jatrophae]SFS03767.1 type VI secretion system protein ImpE [Sphingomonas jatrophae]